MIFTPTLGFVEAIINHPTVRPTVQSGIYYLEAQRLVSDKRNVTLAAEGGVVLFEWLYPGAYQGHVFTMLGYRGKAALKLVSEAIDVLFTVHEARLLVAEAPWVLPHVSLLCRRLGFTAVPLDLVDDMTQVERFRMERL